MYATFTWVEYIREVFTVAYKRTKEMDRIVSEYIVCILHVLYSVCFVWYM